VTVTPVGPQEIGVAVTSRRPGIKLTEALREIPTLAERIGDAPAASRARGAAAPTHRFAEITRGQFALVGDASASVDPLTGEGLGLAFVQAEALTESMFDRDLDAYHAAHRRINRVARLLSRVALAMDAQPWLRTTVLKTLSCKPQIFSSLLHGYVRALTPKERLAVGQAQSDRRFRGDFDAGFRGAGYSKSTQAKHPS
jgi:flavin-dependent dehydrogenase